MMKGVSESLAGRVAAFEMTSLSLQEIEGRNEGLFTTELSQVGKLNEFYDFLVYIEARTAQKIKYDEIFKQIGVSAPTIKSWITILERSGIIFILLSYFSNITDRLVKIPKLYFMDTGLAAYLCRWPNAETLQNGHMDGALLETYVVSEIVKSYFNSGTPINNLYYYRDIDQKEIDLLFVKPNSITPIEIKKSKEPSKPDKNFNVLEKFDFNIKPGIILCMNNEIFPINRKCYLVPISLI